MTATKWVVQPNSSSILFKVKHLVILNLLGCFKKFSVSVETNGNDFNNARIYFSTHVDSLSTGNAQYDAFLKSADGFDAQRFPLIEFKTSQFPVTQPEQPFISQGELSIKGITKNVALTVTFDGIYQDENGNEMTSFTLRTRLNRKDFGLYWSPSVEKGRFVSEIVRMSAVIQLVKVPQPIECTQKPYGKCVEAA